MLAAAVLCALCFCTWSEGSFSFLREVMCTLSFQSLENQLIVAPQLPSINAIIINPTRRQTVAADLQLPSIWRRPLPLPAWRLDAGSLVGVKASIEDEKGESTSDQQAIVERLLAPQFEWKGATKDMPRRPATKSIASLFWKILPTVMPTSLMKIYLRLYY